MSIESNPVKNPSAVTSAGVQGSARLYSLDALRGFDMLMIMGVDAFFHKLFKASGSPFWGVISEQFDHPAWNGFHFYDLIFPLFLFIAGVATPFSIESRVRKGSTKTQLLRHVVQRGLILVLLGIVYNNGLQIKPIDEMRFASVLGRIGLAYMFANIIFLYAGKRAQVIWFGMLLTGYWLLLRFTSAPGYPAGDLTMEGNFVSYFDRLYLPGHLYNKIHDPEGFLSTIPAIGTGLLGIFTGSFLKSNSLPTARKAGRLALAGIISLVLALAWNVILPINKNLWTSSFVLCTGGISLLLTAVFYYVIDVKGYKNWTLFFRVIGMNSILIYLAGEFISWNYTNNAFFHWLGQLVGKPYDVVVLAATFVFVQWVFLYILYKKKVFLKV